jgi:hypothetical protein
MPMLAIIGRVKVQMFYGDHNPPTCMSMAAVMLP